MRGAASRAWIPGPAGVWQPVDVTDGIFQGESAASKAVAATSTARMRRVPEAAAVSRAQMGTRMYHDDVILDVEATE
eukprot:5371211-Alexandrium_andersonii.AAC.1